MSYWFIEKFLKIIFNRQNENTKEYSEESEKSEKAEVT